MAYFDEEGFTKDAEAAGYGKETIAAHIAKIRASDAVEKHDTVTRMLAPAAAASAPAVAAAPAAAPVPAAAVPPVAKPITSATTPAELFDMRPKGTPVERIGGMINEASTAAAPVAANATQSALDYARDAIANNPELTGALAAIPVLYGANKLGLFDTLGSKMSSSAQPQPFVGGSGPRVTPQPDQMAGSYWDWANKQPGNQASGSPSAGQPQAWDIHGEPPLFAPTPAAAPTVTAAPVAAPVNTKLQELQARAAAGIPTNVAPTVSGTPAAPAPPVMSERQSAIAEADARLAAVRNSPEVQNSVWGALSSNETPAEAEARKSIGQAKLAAAIEAHDQEVRAAYKLSEAPAIQEIGPPEFTGPRRPVVPTPPAALAATTTPAPVEPPPKAKLTWPGLAEEPGPLRWTANTLGTTKDVKGSQAAFEMAKDKLTALGVDLAPVHPETGKKTGGGLIPEGHVALNDFYQTYTGESLPKGGRIESEQKLKLYDALKTHLEEAHASGTLKNLGRGAIAAASILGISEAVKAAQRGDNSKLAELGFDVGISAIPPLRTAVTALMGTTLQSGTLPNGDRDYSEVLNRPGVRQVLQNMSKVMTPAQFNAGADKYLSKVSSFPEYNSSRFTKPVIGSTQPINRRTLLPIAPPR